ncbi:MAG: flagellar export protein FliJ [Anaerosporomusa subterranea]|jgi:flagellar FliJ protein|nr:flagellar export protein FliJ [Anaerosporomusa subterranea]
MQRFQFRLEALLKYRKLQTDQAQAELGQATVEWQNQLSALNTLFEKKEQLSEHLRDIQQTPILVDDLVSCHEYGQILRNKINQQKETVHIAEQYCDECRQRLSESLKRQKLVEKIREKRWTQFNEELLRQEQKELDEIGLQLHVRGE